MAIAPIPLPHWLIWGHPAIETVPNTVHRAVTSIAVAYWRGNCNPLPADDPTMAVLARMPLQHWTPIKSAVMAAIEQIIPELRKDYGERLQSRLNKRRSAQELTVRRMAKRKTQTSPQAMFAVPTRDTDTPTPRPPTTHIIDGRNGTAAASKAKPATFTD